MSLILVSVILSFILASDVISAGINPVDTNSLVAVAVLYRHGDRAPLDSYPNDPFHEESYWPDGYGQLLDAGKLRQYNLGKWLRNRYDKFLSQKYVKKEITVQSSNVDRCLMSASSNLAGLYLLNQTDGWNNELPWQPVPIHTRPIEEDSYLAMEKSCTRHQKLVENLIKNDEYFKQLPVKYEEEYNILRENTGWNVSLDNFEGLYTTFYVYAMHNKSFLPSWANALNKTNFEFLAGLSFASETYTDALKILKAGPLFSHLLTFFDNAANGTANPKFLMLSAHDTTVVAALNTLGVYDMVPPEFTATVIWELHKDQKGENIIKIFYKQPNTGEELVMPSCKQPCSYESFSSFLNMYARDEKTWEQMCRSSSIQVGNK